MALLRKGLDGVEAWMQKGRSRRSFSSGTHSINFARKTMQATNLPT